jgi:3'-5' exonuclease
MLSVLVFDIETVPDVEYSKRIHDFAGLTEEDIAKALFNQSRQKTGNEFLRHYLHRIVAISIVLKMPNKIKVWSLGEEDSSEAELIQRFYDGIEKYRPTLVSWNGTGFDLPVLHYRALLHGINAQQYWEMGDNERDWRYNNYLSRYHWRHMDLMDILSGFQPRASAKLDEIASLLGFPGKMGMDGSKVWDSFQNNDVKGIRDYCETDVLNTYLVFLKFEVMRGHLTHEGFESECEALQDYLAWHNQPHFNEFLTAWKGSVTENDSSKFIDIKDEIELNER